MEPLGPEVSVVAIARLQDSIQHIREDLRTKDGRVDDQQVARSLEASQQKLQVWQKTWLDSSLDTTTTCIALWGTQGCTEIHKLLQGVSNTIFKIKDAYTERDNIESRTSFFDNDNTQVAKDDGVKNKSRRPWKRALQRMSSTKKSPAFVVKLPTKLELATELSSSIDELWTYSELTFNSLHGLLATRTVGPPSGHLLALFLADAIRTRVASIALYRACSKSTRNCSLEMDLTGTETRLRRGVPGSSDSSLSLFYHLSTQSRSSPAERLDMTIESVTRPGTPVTENSEALEYEDPDLADFSTSSASDTEIVIRPRFAGTKSYFRVAKQPVQAMLTPETQNLAQILYQGKISSTTSLTQILPFSVRIEMAYKLVECALYLLGTPWLASLNSKRLRRMYLEGGRRSYVLEVQTLDLDELSFEDPEALAEPSQLFRIGVLLVEIALSNPEHSAPTEIQELDLRTSKMLTLVQQSMGPQYYKATAFCLHDRRSTSHFGSPEKYQYPEKTGWKPYLLELLKEYHSQVFLR